MGKVAKKRQRGTTGKRAIRSRMLESRSVEMRLEGRPYSAIGTELGVQPGVACRAVQRVLERTAKQTGETADKVRELELCRLDKAHSLIWERVMSADIDPPVVLKAIETMLKIMDRRAKFLGLDAIDRAETGALDEWMALVRAASDRADQKQLNSGQPEVVDVSSVLVEET